MRSTKHGQAACFAVALCVVLYGMGCMTTNSRDELLATNSSQLQLRSIQSRAFDTGDKEKTMRAILATLQDLSFVLDKVDADLGIATGTKYYNHGNSLKMTVSVRSKSASQLVVRANAQVGQKAIEDPEPYQDFFVSLEKAMFLSAQQVD